MIGAAEVFLKITPLSKTVEKRTEKTVDDMFLQAAAVPDAVHILVSGIWCIYRINIILGI